MLWSKVWDIKTKNEKNLQIMCCTVTTSRHHIISLLPANLIFMSCFGLFSSRFQQYSNHLSFERINYYAMMVKFVIKFHSFFASISSTWMMIILINLYIYKDTKFMLDFRIFGQYDKANIYSIFFTSEIFMKEKYFD